MEYYNKYFSYLQQPYNAEIAFLSNDKFLENEIFFLEFIDEYRKKRGFYRDQSGYLKSLFWEARKSGMGVEKYVLQETNLITNLQHNKQYHSYIQVLDDPQNPQLKGQYMIFKFGLKIYGIIKDKCSSPIHNRFSCFNDIFNLKIELIKTHFGQIFPNFEKSQFLEKHYTQPYPELPPLDSFVHFSNFNLLSMKRKEKLEKIQKSLFLP